MAEILNNFILGMIDFETACSLLEKLLTKEILKEVMIDNTTLIDKEQK